MLILVALIFYCKFIIMKRNIEIKQLAQNLGLEYKPQEDFNDGYLQYIKMAFWKTIPLDLIPKIKLYNFVTGNLKGRQIMFFDFLLIGWDWDHSGSIIKINDKIYPFRGGEIKSSLLKDYFYDLNETKLAAASRENSKNRLILGIVVLICMVIFIILMFIFKI